MNTNKKIIAIVGMCGAGKSQVSDYLVKKGYAFLRFGQLTLDICKAKGLSGEAEEKKIREGLRQEHGMAAFAILNISKIDELLQSGNQVVVDGLYSWSEYKVLKDKYGDDLKILAVYAPPKLRYNRLSSRQHDAQKDTAIRFRPFTVEQAKARDYAEIENIEKGGPIVMADFTIVNDADFKHLYKQIDTFLNNL
jgi:dephospho-CoA kinase